MAMFRRLPVLAGLTAAMISFTSQDANADKTCLVSKFQYVNNGGYVAKNFTIRNSNAKDDRGGEASLGEQKTMTLKEQNGIVEGREIWLEYVIVVAGNEFITCRKDSTKLIFDSELGNTWNYKSKGTTSDGNRCRFGDNDCISPN